MLPTSIELNDEAMELVARRFKLLSDPMRLKILHALHSGEKTVTEIVELTGSTQPNISKHLAALRNGGLVRRRSESNLAYFSIAAPFIFELCDRVCQSIATELDSLQKNFSLQNPTK